jgi:hypothetical protein
MQFDYYCVFLLVYVDAKAGGWLAIVLCNETANGSLCRTAPARPCGIHKVYTLSHFGSIAP